MNNQYFPRERIGVVNINGFLCDCRNSRFLVHENIYQDTLYQVKLICVHCSKETIRKVGKKVEKSNGV